MNLIIITFKLYMLMISLSGHAHIYLEKHAVRNTGAVLHRRFYLGFHLRVVGGGGVGRFP